MDADRFDDFLRTMTEAPTRRGIARALTGLALAGPLSASLGPADSDAKKKRKKKKKKCKGKKKCGKKCIPKSNCCTDADCANDGESCVGGACACPEGQDACGGACLDSCPTVRVRNPIGCGCCRPNDAIEPVCDSDPCCSGLDCSPYVGGQTICLGRPIGQPCSFDEQCDSGFCNPNLVCA